MAGVGPGIGVWRTAYDTVVIAATDLWILATGFWRDTGVWEDPDLWSD